ncbi:MAG: hypothetical protein Q9O24_12355 [Gammaproteobacteria bacterium]|nr:hypothetical protein [Gammaproteobacteria bacterium]
MNKYRVLMLLFGAWIGLSLNACVCVDCGYTPVPDAKPIYLSYTDLRASVAVKPAQPLLKPAKIYSYQNHLFINEPNQGVHVFDNIDKTAPQNIGFISIPGNVDIAIKGGFLYADSYIDLVVIDIRDPANILEVGRQKAIFPYDAYQNVPQQVYLGWVDESKGVVVGFNYGSGQ